MIETQTITKKKTIQAKLRSKYKKCFRCNSESLIFEKNYPHGNLDEEKDDVLHCTKCDCIHGLGFHEFPVRLTENIVNIKNWD